MHPLYRQEQQWARRGINISRQNMSNWIMHAQTWLQPIYDRMKAKLLAQDIIHADETTLQVLLRRRQESGIQVVYVAVPDRKCWATDCTFEYQPSRSAEHLRDFLKGFKGYLVTDAYSGDNDIPDVTNVYCWAHARRGFDEAIKAAGKKANNSQGDGRP